MDIEKNNYNMEKAQTKEKVENTTNKHSKNDTKKNKNRMYIVLLFIIFVGIIGYVIFRGEYLEILETGEKYISVYWQNFNYTALTFGINFILLFSIIYINNNRIKKALKPFFEIEKKEMPKLPNKSISFILSVIISGITNKMFLKQYMLFTNSAEFGSVDPIFGYDIGYFMFQKPFIETVLFYLMAIIVGITIYTVIYYIVVFNIYFDGIERETLKTSKLLKQLFTNIKILSILLAVFVFVKTQDIGFDKFLNLREDTSYSIYGARYCRFYNKIMGV